MNEVNERIKQKRKELGLTLQEASAKFGLTITGYAHIENGKSSINIDRLYQIAEIFGVSVGELLGLEGVQSVPNGEQASKVEALEREVERLQERATLWERLNQKTETENQNVHKQISNVILLAQDIKEFNHFSNITFFAVPIPDRFWKTAKGKFVFFENTPHYTTDYPYTSIEVYRGFMDTPPRLHKNAEDYKLANLIDLRLLEDVLFSDPVIYTIFEQNLVKDNYWTEKYEKYKNKSNDDIDKLTMLNIFQQEANRLFQTNSSVDIFGRQAQLKEAWEYTVKMRSDFLDTLSQF